jgi:hypothetical protein
VEKVRSSVAINGEEMCRQVLVIIIKNRQRQNCQALGILWANSFEWLCTLTLYSVVQGKFKPIRLHTLVIGDTKETDYRNESCTLQDSRVEQRV